MISPGEITWAPDGARFLLNDDGKLSLYELATARQRDIIEFSRLDAAAVKTTTPAVFDWTNRRVNENDVQWFADGKRLLVSASGDLFVVDISKGSFTALTQTPEIERDPKLSPDNRFVSFRRGHDLWVVEISPGKETRLTANGSDTLLNAELDWVYPEELDLDTAHWWAPDSQSIAYLQFDVSREPIYPQVNLLNARGVLEPERYPKAGEPNAEVRLGIVPVQGGLTRWMQLGDPRDFLLARVAWAPDSRSVMAERLNRIQNRLDLLLADAATGAARTVLHEEDPYWINVAEGPRFVGNDRFLWTSERSGFRHLYFYKTNGTLEKQLTSGNWEVNSVLEVTKDRILFTSTEAGPLERQLYEVDFAGNRKRLSQGAGTHTISAAPTGAYYMDDFSGLGDLPRSTICNGDGSPLRVFRKPEPAVSEEYEILPTEIVPVKAADGTVLYARLIKPAGFQAGRKYPAVVMVYGGPGVQSILNSWQGLSWDQVLAHKGFVIWQLDNRGSMGRGHAFESPIFRDMGEHELADQKTGIEALIGMGFVDAKRIGLFGWSYGGYMTLYTVTHAPGLIRAAISGAPVTDWRNYDTIYTERYMGLPEENAEAYRKSSPQSAAAGLEGTKLLILHNIEDDNVHFQNSVQMADAFEKAGKQFYMVVYPQRSHGVTGPARRQLLEENTAFFEENLKP
jgi:dipeptidyl-peptidase-4